MVKPLRQKSHFVLALGFNPYAQVTLPPTLYARLQVFQTTREPTHYGVGGQGYRQRDQGQGSEKSQGRKPTIARGAR